jgi:hypothetical protein
MVCHELSQQPPSAAPSSSKKQSGIIKVEELAKEVN